MEQHAGQNANEREAEDVDDDRGVHLSIRRGQKMCMTHMCRGKRIAACLRACTVCSCVRAETVEAETIQLKIN